MVRAVPATPVIPAAAAVGSLTERELEVLRLVGLSHTDEQAAAILVISISTVRFHVKQLNRKLGTLNRAHLAVTAVQHGLSHPPGSP